MSSMSGLAVLERFRGQPGIVGSTIMMLDSVNQVSDALLSRELGVSICLTKPICEKELLEATRRILCKEPQVGQAVSVLPTVSGHSGSAIRVLLAEDNAVNRKLAVRILEKRGFRVTTAENGRAALEALKKDHFDLVLMDIQMPGMDGFEATAEIRRSERGASRRLPIIAMTAHAMKGDEEKCLAAGMDGYVSKPISVPELMTAINTVLQAVHADVASKQ